MSASSRIFIGPYFECIGPIIKEDLYHKKCPTCKAQHVDDPDLKFCANCGTVLERIQTDIIINHHHYYEKAMVTRESFCNELFRIERLSSLESGTQIDFYIPNIKGYGNYIDTDESVDHLEINSDVMTYERNMFNVNFEIQFNLLLSVYGKVYIKYGIVSYWI